MENNSTLISDEGIVEKKDILGITVITICIIMIAILIVLGTLTIIT